MRQVWELTVDNATIKAIAGPARNAQNGIGAWKWNLARKLFPIIYATGRAIKNEIKSHFT